MTLGTAEGSIPNDKRMCGKWRGNHAAYHLAAQNFHSDGGRGFETATTLLQEMFKRKKGN